MDRDEFYVVLPSDNSMNVFPQNKTTKFTSQLPRHLNLSGNWTVALTEIQYPQTFLHIPDSPDERTIVIGHGDIFSIFMIPSGVYKDINELLSVLNSKEFANHYRIELDAGNIIKISILCPEECKQRTKSSFNFCATPEHVIKLGCNIEKILGFKPTKKQNHYLGGKLPFIKGAHPVSLASAIPNTMYVYTDICEQTIIGNVEAQILHIVPIDIGKYIFGRIKAHTLSPLRYIPVLRKNFQTIEIDIRDHLGEPIPFEFGSLTVTLHFKRIE